MEKLQARKKVYLWLLILLSLCALIPLAVLSKYNHQSGDDYGYAYRTFQIWRETHSFWNVIKEAFATSAEFYQKWQGLYASGGSAGAGTGNFRRQILRADRNLAARNYCGGKLRGYGLYLSPQMRLPETGGICCRLCHVVSYDRMDALRPAGIVLV